MTSPTRLVWELAGRPDPVESAARLLGDVGVCRMSGDDDLQCAPADKALGKNWTDPACWARPDSTVVNTAAVWCCSGKPPHSLRMWTILAAPGWDAPASADKCVMPAGPGLAYINRGNPGPLVDMLASPPDGEWLASVAVSGQKHVLPYATVNHGSGRWTVRMETCNVTATPAEWSAVHASCVALRLAGCSDDDIKAGRPTPKIRTSKALAEWRHHADTIAPHRTSPLVDLALWTITKGTLTHA